jgi:hypothetical protein
VVGKTSLVLPKCIIITGGERWGIGAIDDNLGVMFVSVNETSFCYAVIEI